MIDSLTFRLTLIYVWLFVGSMALLGFAYYWSSIRHPLHSIETRIEHEASSLDELYRRGGSAALARQLELRRRTSSDRLPFDALIAPDGRVVTRNLPNWPAWTGGGWHRIEVSSFPDSDGYDVLTLDRRFNDGARLLLGWDVEDLDDREQALGSAVAWLLGSAVLLGLGGGMLMSRTVGRRIDAVSRTARQVMDGDLSGRVPIRGGGDDFDRLAATLNAMLARIESLFEAVRRVSDNVAHELRTPLMRLRANLEALHASSDSPALLEDALAEATRLDRTFDAVLRIARIESGRHERDFEPIELGALLRDAAEVYEPAAEESHQSIAITAAEPVMIRGDKDLLFQSVCNLLDNAIKYGSKGYRIALIAERTAAGAQLVVMDDGEGVPEADRARITERFYRSTSTFDAPGVGLGLSFVAAVAELHHARLTFEDAHPGLLVRLLFRTDERRGAQQSARQPA